MNVRHLMLICASLALLAGAGHPWTVFAASSERQIKKPVKQQKVPRRRLSLLPKLCVEQFVEDASSRVVGGGAATDEEFAPTAAPVDSVRVTTDWGIAPFVGSAASPVAEAPERNPEPGGATLPGSEPLCLIDAGVSYNLAPGARLDLGYRLPSSNWGSMFNLLGEESKMPTDKKVSVGIQFEF